MRAILILLGLVFVGSLSLNAIQYHKLDAADKTIAALQAQNAALIIARNADQAAMQTALDGRKQANDKAKEGRDALQKADICTDDADYLDAIARLWQDRAASCRRATPGNAAGGLQ